MAVKTINGLAVGSVKTRNGLAASSIKTVNGLTVDHGPPEVPIWQAAVSAASGTLAGDSLTIATDLMTALNAAGYRSKIKWLLPFLGSNLAAHRVPLIDDMGKGIAGNFGFVDADVSQSTGLQCGTGKYLDSLIYPSDLNATNQRGGLGLWELSGNSARVPFGSNNMFGCHSSGSQYGIQLYSAAQIIWWGATADSRRAISPADSNTGFHYAQRSAVNDLSLYYNIDTASATNSATYTPVNMGDYTMFVGALNTAGTPTYGGSRIGAALATDGTLSHAEIVLLRGVLNTYLIGPTGR